jgi:hypothetical protein
MAFCGVYIGPKRIEESNDFGREERFVGISKFFKSENVPRGLCDRNASRALWDFSCSLTARLAERTLCDCSMRVEETEKSRCEVREGGCG